jgi:hypothetical protein
MVHGHNKYQSRENRARVRELFIDEWDPIGVRGVSEATDEYDAYVAKAYVMLMDERATAEQITDYLWGVATEYMGLTPYPALRDRCADTAKMLIAVRPDFETH